MVYMVVPVSRFQSVIWSVYFDIFFANDIVIVKAKHKRTVQSIPPFLRSTQGPILSAFRESNGSLGEIR